MEPNNLEVDARSWIGWAFGLSTTQISPESVKTGFKSIFFELVNYYCSTANIIASNKVNTFKHTRMFYLMPKQRYKFLEEKFKQHTFLYEYMIVKFARLWTTNILNKLVTDVSEEIQKGKVIGSFVSIIQDAMKYLLAPVVADLIRRLVSCFNLESFLQNITQKDEYKTLTIAIINSIEVPSYKDLIRRNQYPTLLVDSQPDFPPTLPFYDVISKYLSSFFRIAIRDSAPTSLTEKVLHILKKHKILQAINVINKSETLLKSFKRDFLIRTLGLSGLSPAIIEICEGLLDHLRNDNDVVRIFELAFTHKKEFTYLYSCCRALSKLNNLTREEISNITSEFKVVSNVDITNQLAPLISTITVRILKERLRTILTVEEHTVKDLEMWYKCFKTLYNRLSTQSIFIELSQDEIVHYMIMQCLFLWILNFGKLVEALALFKSEQVKNFISQYGLLGGEVRGSCLFDNALELGELLYLGYQEQQKQPPTTPLDEDNDGEESEQQHQPLAKLPITYFVQDIYNIFFPLKSQYSAQIFKRKNLETFYILVAGVKSSGSIIWKYVSFTWAVNALMRWRENQTDDIKDIMVETAGMIISRIKQIKRPNDYRFDPPLLLLNETILQSLKNLYPEIPTLEKPSEVEILFYHTFLTEIDASRELWYMCNLYNEQLTRNSAERIIMDKIRKSAISSAIINAAARDLSSRSDINETISGWPTDPTNVLKTLNTVLKATPYGKAYLITQLSPEICINFLKQEKVLANLGMNDWIIKQDVFLTNTCQFSFMIEIDTPLGKIYRKIKDTIATGKPKALLQIPAQCKSILDPKYDIIRVMRMNVILVAYYEYFNNNRECTAVLEALKDPEFINLLQITAPELVAFQFLSSQPKSTTIDDLDVPPLFSQQARLSDSKVDITIANIMVNCLAVTLGSPRQTNYMYPRIFEPQLPNPFCPGSDYSRQNRDCGFRMEGPTLSNGNPPVMGNNRHYRLALNTLTWASLTWSCLLNESNFPHMRNYALNYWSDDGNKLDQRRAVKRTDVQKIRFYIFTRAQTFFQYFCNDSEVVDRHILGSHFITECLLRLFYICNEPTASRIACVKEIHASAEETITFENIFKDEILVRVSQNYVQLKETFQKSLQGNAISAIVIKLQDNQSQYQLSPVSTFPKFLTLFASVPDDRCTLLRKFIEKLPVLEQLKYVPSFVHFYQSMLKIFGNRISQEESRENGVPACLKIIQSKKLETDRVIEEFNRVWNKFKTEFAEIRQVLGQLEAVCAFQALREYELQIPEITDQTPLVTMVTEEVDSTDAVMTVVGRILKCQADIIGVRDSNYRNMDKKELIFEIKPNTSVEALPYERDNQSVFFGLDWLERDWEKFMLTQIITSDSLKREEITFDFGRIENEILRRSDGKTTVSVKISKWPFANKLEEIDLPNEKSTDDTKNSSLVGIDPLYRLVTAIRDTSRYAKVPPDEVLNKWKTSLSSSKNTKKDITDLASYLYQIMQYLLTDNPETGEKNGSFY